MQVEHEFERNGEKTVEHKEFDLELVAARDASLDQFMTFYNVTLMNPKVLCGMFSGVLLAFLFCAMTMKAVGRAANQMMKECRRQFEKIRQALRNDGKDEAFVQDPDNWPKRVEVEGHKYPDYANCVAISTAGAQKEMIVALRCWRSRCRLRSVCSLRTGRDGPARGRPNQRFRTGDLHGQRGRCLGQR